MGISFFKRKLKSQKGATGADVVVALSIITISIAVVSMIYINLTNGGKRINRTAGATRIATNIFENIDRLTYSQFERAIAVIEIGKGENTAESKQQVNDYNLNGLNVILTKANSNEIFGTKIPRGYDYELKVVTSPYNINAAGQKQIDANTKYDLMCEISLTIFFKVNNVQESVSLQTVKQREDSIVSNKPDMSQLSSTAVPLKYSTVANSFVATTKDDPEWYNYLNKEWAVVYDNPSNLVDLSNAGVLAEGKIDITQDSINQYVKLWVPRIDSSTGSVFLFGTSNYPLVETKIPMIGNASSNLILYAPDTTITTYSPANKATDEAFGDGIGEWVTFTYFNTLKRMIQENNTTEINKAANTAIYKLLTGPYGPFEW